MKKIVSLLIALVLCVSVFSVSAVAFAADGSAPNLVGAWAENDAANDDGSRIKVTEKEFSGTIKYKETTGESTTTRTANVSGKYSFVSGVFTPTFDKDDVTLEVTYDSAANTLTFKDTTAGENEGDPRVELYTKTFARREIAYVDSTFAELDEVKNVDKVQGASETFQFDYDWLADEAKVESIFKGISYTLKFGNWKASLASDTELSVEWEQNGITKTATLNKTESSDSDNKFVGTWEGTLADKSVKLVFDTTKKVAVTRNGLSLGSVNYEKGDDNVATFTTGDTAKRFAVAEGSDKVYVQYATPTVDYKDFASWNTVEIGTDINVIGTTSSTSRIGWWVFRFVVKDSNGTVLTDNAGTEVRSDRIDIWFGDASAPAYRDNNGLTSDMISTRDNGLTVDANYTIKTNLRYIDNGSVTVNYKVYKWDTKTNDWTKDPILVKGEEVAEGYENCITSAGVITPLASDVLADNKPVYRIVYSLVDDQLYESDTTTLDLFVKNAEDKTVSSTDVWKIILYVIAGLSAVGIVVVLCIKPKKPETEDARSVNAETANNETKSGKNADTTDNNDKSDE
ncbi:MAG: hypothetical protein NC132_05640 [Corallococcus sp.]|nr:hypothetical protein [Corallococcus sp.]MCM1360014.1 hypothetical protein [Corallococcus sp.]MCM1395571.1 hypothetical protein [Corallococcus sp.]